MISPLWALLGAVAPGIWFFMRIRKVWAPAANLHFLGTHLLAGAAIAIFAAALEWLLLESVLKMVSGTFSLFLQAFLVAALVEEGLKSLGVKSAADRALQYQHDAYTAFAASLSVGLGFAILECALYALNTPNGMVVGIVRYATAVPLHFLCGMLFSIAYVSHAYGQKAELGFTFLVITVAHGFYDYLLFVQDGDEWLIFGVLAALWAYVRWIQRQFGIKPSALRS
jgi:RsiW-degrading membrane proteinase PrsW (M82 family)